MQFEITDAAAKTFAEELYYCLIDRRYPVDAAVAEARKAMMDINQIEFATPVLFLRPGNADLFNFADPPAAATADIESSPLAAAPSAAAAPPSPRPTRRRTPSSLRTHHPRDRGGRAG